MRVFSKKMKTSLTFLSQILASIKAIRLFYADYLNTGDKNYWEDMIPDKHFVLCYWQIMDRELMPEEYFPQLKELIEKHHDLCLAIDSKDEEAFNLLAYFYQGTKKLFFSELKRKNISIDLNSEDLDSKVAEIIEYEEESDLKTAIEDFKLNLALDK